MKFKYDIGEKVNVPSLDESGEVLKREFCLFDPFLRDVWFPSKVYSVMIQDNYVLGGEEKTSNVAKVYFREKNLGKVKPSSKVFDHCGPLQEQYSGTTSF